MTDYLPAPTRHQRIIEPSRIIQPPPDEPPSNGQQPTRVITVERIDTPPPRTPIPPQPQATDRTAPTEPEAEQPPRTTRIRRPRHVDLNKPAADEPQPDVEDTAEDEPEPAEDTEPRASRRRRLAQAVTDGTAARWAIPRDTRQRGRVRVLLVTGIAAGIGWQLGYGPFLSASIAHLGQADPKWGVGLGLLAVAGGLTVDIGLRGGRPLAQITSWSLVPATLARVPLATAVLALGLYAPGRI